MISIFRAYINSRARILALATIVLFFNIPSFAQAGSSAGQGNASQAVQSGPSGKITGHVYRADDGQPIAGAQVVLMPTATGSGVEAARRAIDARQNVITDSEGAYIFATVSPGNYDLRAEHAGFVSKFFNHVNKSGDEPDFEHSMELVMVSAGQTLSKIDFRLSAAAVISGNISREDKQPLPWIQVSAVQYRYLRGGQQQMQPVYFGITDKSGNYSLPGLLPGTYFVRASNLNRNVQSGGAGLQSVYYPEAATLDNAQRMHVMAGSQITGTNFIIAQQKVYTIGGVIVDPAGSGPSQSYWIKTTRLGTIPDDTTGAEFQSQRGAEIPFALHGLPPGDYVLTAEKNPPLPGASGPRGYGTATVRVADGDAHINVQISSGAEVNGKLLVDRSPNRVIAGVRIHLEPMPPSYGFNLSEIRAETGQDGRFKFQDVQPGEYFFSLEEEDNSVAYLKNVVCDGKDYTKQPLAITSAARIENCEVTVAGDLGAVNGIVRNGDKPATNLLVVAIPQLRSLRPQARYTITANTNEKGQYQLSAVTPGDYLVFAVTPDVEQTYFAIDFADRHQQDAAPVTVKPGETKALDLKPSKTN